MCKSTKFFVLFDTKMNVMLQNTPKKSSKFTRNHLFKVIYFVILAIAIIYSLPREDQFAFQFAQNKPWRYELLTAPFDFPIYRDTLAIEKDKDSIIQHYIPYYSQNRSMLGKQLADLRNNNLEGIPTTLPTTYLKYVENHLKTIYETGLLSNTSRDSLSKTKKTHIRLVSKKVAVVTDINKLYTRKTAYKYLMSADSTKYDIPLFVKADLSRYLVPNINYDQIKNETALSDALSSINTISGTIQQGERIVDRGEVITGHLFHVLNSFKQESLQRMGSHREENFILLGQSLYVCLLLLIFMWYLELFRNTFYKKKKNLSMLFVLILLYTIGTSLLVRHPIFSIYIIPFCIAPVVIRIFVDARTAFMTHMVIVLLCAIPLQFPYEFIVQQIIAGLIAIYSLKEFSNRSHLLRTTLFVVLTYIVVYMCLELIAGTRLQDITYARLMLYVTNGILLLFTYPIMILIERFFGFISSVTLVELSNSNLPLLKRLSQEAPGTFQHSIQVSNLASEAALQIGADSQLVRTGAMYHDIGKMLDPTYFTENQSGFNPHTLLDYKQSAQTVIRHITEGMKMADKYNLPDAVKQFITTHHGAGKAKYFYISWKNEHPDEPIDDSIFSYPGPNPQTKEQGILMMADSIEAASRSLPEYTEENISEVVDRIINTQIKEGFMDACPLTMREINTIRETFKEKLKIMHHTRVSYPTLNKEETNESSFSRDIIKE